MQQNPLESHTGWRRVPSRWRLQLVYDFLLEPDFHWSFDIVSLVLGWDVSGTRKKNEKENLRMLLIPKNHSNPEHYTLGSWKRDSNLSSFFAQIRAPIYFYVPGEDWMQPYRWLTVFLSTGLADGIDCSPGDHRGYISLRMQDSGSAPCLHEWNHLPGTKTQRGCSAQAEFLIKISLVWM